MGTKKNNKEETPRTTPGSPDVDARFQLVLTLIALLKSARHKVRKSELEFQMVNQTYNLVPYRHCVYWEKDGQNVSLRTASGLVQLDRDGPYARWLRAVIAQALEKEPAQAPADDPAYAHLRKVTPTECAPAQQEDWKNWSGAEALLLPMRNKAGQVVRGLWCDREEAYTSLETALLDDLADGYAHILQHFDEEKAEKKSRALRRMLSPSSGKLKYVVLAVILFMLIPVRLNITAPSEVVARDPVIVTVPFDGIIDKVDVQPGATVKEGDVLVRMDSTMLQNKADAAAGELQTASIALMKTEREALGDRAKLAEIAILESQVEQKQAELAYARDMLARAEIRATRDGIVIFPDPNAMRGKPVQTGERIMQLADPEETELLMRVPVDAMIRIDRDVPARFFLNVMPFGYSEAVYKNISYQATMDPDGLMTYKLRADFVDEDSAPRIGWTGTGKIFGHRTIMAFNLLRRPLITLRRKLGV